MKRLVILLIVLNLAALATSITLLAPVNSAVNGDEPIHIGVIGPGQTVELQFSRDTDLPAAINPTTGKNALWDKASVVQSTLPSGWTSKDSLKYENPLTVFVTASPNAEKKSYVFSVGFIDEYEGTQPQTARFQVDVDPDVLSVSLDAPTVQAGVGQPGVFTLRARSTSSASDTFVIKAAGLPYDWQFSKTFFLPRQEEKVVFFEVVGNIQKEVPFEIIVSSVSSPNINATVQAQLITASNLLQDAKATSLGLPLFPSVEQQIYALIGLLSNLVFK